MASGGYDQGTSAGKGNWDISLTWNAFNYFEQGQSVVLVEDLISSGKSSLDAATVLREAGMHVKGMVSIFTYGFDTGIEDFKAAECEYVSLCDYNTLLPEAIKSQHIEKTDLAILKQWRENPSIWKK